MMAKYYVRISGYGEFWCKDHKFCAFHRVFGPATTWRDGHISWHLDDKLHRIGGPAVTGRSGHLDYYLHGTQYTKEKYEQILRKNW